MESGVAIRRRAFSLVLCICVFAPQLVRAGNFYAGTRPGNVPWPGGAVPYEFTNTLNAAQQKAYLEGLREWELAANVKFVRHTNQTRWILFAYDTNSFDRISSGYGPQVVTVNNLSRAQVCHQMGHSFGLTHENIRKDQTSYLVVVTNNILGATTNLHWFNFDATTVTNGVYDFESVMHLGWDFASVQPGVLPTEQPLPQYASRYSRRMGNLCLSPGDRAALAYLYGPPAVPLTNIVTTTADAGAGSLRAALYYATDHAGTAVRFSVPLSDSGLSNGVFNFHLSGQLPPLVGNGILIDGTAQPGFGSQMQGPMPVDVFIDFEAGTNGQIVTPAILAAGTHGDGAWSTTVALTNMPLHYGSITNVATRALPAPVAVGGAIYQGGPGTRALAMRNEQWEEAALTYGTTHDKVAVGYWWNPGFGGASDFNWNDEVSIMSTGWADEWCINSWECSGTASQIVKVHSNAGTGVAINLTGVGTNNSHWYWVSQLYEAGAQSKLAIFDTNLNQIGPTSTLPITNLPAKDIEFGQHHAVGNHPSLSFYKNAVIAYDAKAVFPLIPTNFSGAPFDGEPLVVLDGSQILPDSRNTNNGLLIYSTSNQVRNVSFSGFNGSGVALSGAEATNNSIAGCWFGVDPSGTNAAPNGTQGILLSGGASSNVIGGTNGSARNLISGNGQYGICLAGFGTSGNSVLGNLIGTDAGGTNALGNGLANIALVEGASSNSIGSTMAGAGNTVAFSAGPGVSLSGSATTNNAIRGNSIFRNTGLGIDLNNDGVTLNDEGDPDLGANNLQNFPAITAACDFGGSAIIAGQLNSASNASFQIDLYSTPVAGSSGYGDGKTWLGSVATTTDASGNGLFGWTNMALSLAGQLIAATATASSDDTSEFSLAVLATNKPVLPSVEFTGQLNWRSEGFEFSLLLATNFNYIIQATTNLAELPVAWVDLTNFTATNPVFMFTDPEATNYAARYYRVISP
jgi:hypothetical protein